MKEQVEPKGFAIVFRTQDGVLSYSTFQTNNDAERAVSVLVSQDATLIGGMTVDQARDLVKKTPETAPPDSLYPH